MDGHKGEAFFVIDNLTNMLNDDWGVLKKGPFVGASMISTSLDDQGRYGFTADSKRGAKIWDLQTGQEVSQLSFLQRQAHNANRLLNR